jgi:hypothetical protein
MAKTGIKITTTDTVLGVPIDVNTTSMIVGTEGMFSSTSNLGGGDVISGRSYEELVKKGLQEETMLAYFVKTYFSTDGETDLTGNLLWVGQAETASELKEAIRATTVKSFAERPRQVCIAYAVGDDPSTVDTGGLRTPQTLSSILTDLAREGIRCVAVTSTRLVSENLNLAEALESESFPLNGYPFVAVNIMGEVASAAFPYSDLMTGAAIAVRDLAALSVGTSIGDGGRAPMQNLVEIPLNDGASESSESINVKSLTQAELDLLGEAQVLFTRTRPPRNGVWWNDGATCNDPNNALSTLEAARTICAMADDLQSFFVPYINTRVPVTSTGDIQSAYKQVVLDNARAAVVQKYIESGDISDARINLVAKDNDMIGTRTWEVTLSILPAPTLRWIDGYVFYVNNLS